MSDEIKIHVWLPHDGTVGHASLQIVGDIYISFWPASEVSKGSAKAKSRLKWGTAPAAVASYEDDKQNEGGRDAETVTLVSLEVDPIRAYWVKLLGSKKSYHFLWYNCSTVVAGCLRLGSDTPASIRPSAAAYARLAGLLGEVWTPEEVLRYARELQGKKS